MGSEDLCYNSSIIFGLMLRFEEEAFLRALFERSFNHNLQVETVSQEQFIGDLPEELGRKKNL